MLIKDILLIALFSPKIVFGSNILAICSFPGLSHFLMFKPVLEALAHRGHNVDVVSHFPSKSPTDRYTDISIRGSARIVTNNFTMEDLRHFRGIEKIKRLVNYLISEACEASLKSPQLEILRKSTEKYDLIIFHLFGTDCMLGWGWHFGAPCIAMTTSIGLPWDSHKFGLPDNPSYIPHYFTEQWNSRSLYERILNAWILAQAKFIYYWYGYRPSNSMAKKFFGKNMPDLDMLAQNISLLLLNTHFSFLEARPLVPNVIEVAGLHIQPPKSLNEHFNKILTDPKGIIYFTLGSVISPETMPFDKLQALSEAFAELPYKIIWKADRHNFTNNLSFPENIHFEHWLPQLDILCDPRVKLFITHGGMLGLQEAIFCGVPILGIPLFVDQKINLNIMENLGTAVVVEYDRICKDIVLRAAKKLLTNPRYYKNAKKTQNLFKDRPISSMNTAIYWIEYVIRHKGAARLQSDAKYLEWYQYYLIDVMLVMFATTFVFLYSFMYLIRFIWRNISSLKIKVE